MGAIKITKFSCPNSVVKNASFTISGEIQNIGVQGWGRIEFVNTTNGSKITSHDWFMKPHEKKSLSVGYSIASTSTIVMRAYQIQGTLAIISDVKSKTVQVQQPAPPPSPPQQKKWNLTVETSVPNCEVSISGPTTAKEIADTDGTAEFKNLQEGTYKITAAKTGYKTATKTITLNKNMTVNVFPEKEQPPRQPPGGGGGGQPPSGGEGCPDFWTDPVGAVTCWVFSMIEKALHLAAGSFITMMSNLYSFYRNFAGSLVSFIKDPIGHVREYVLSTWYWITDITGKILEVIGVWWNTNMKAIWDTVQNAALSSRDFIQNIGSWISNWWKAVWPGVAIFIDNAVNAAKAFFQSLFQGLLTAIDNVKKLVMNYIIDRIKEALKIIDNIKKQVMDSITNRIIGVLKIIDDIKKQVMDSITDTITEAVKTIITAGIGIKEIIETITKNVEDWVETKIVEGITSMFGWINDIAETIKAVLAAFLDLYSILTGKEEIPGVEGEIADKYKQLMEDTDEILGG